MYCGHNSNQPGGIYALCRTLIQDRTLSTILDLGARYGEGFEQFGQTVMKNDCEYICVEPSPRCIPKITKLMDKYPEHKIRLIPGVLGKASGSAFLNILDNDGDQSANLFSDRSGQYGLSIKCEVPIFDYATIPDRIDFAKINIEGAEYQLIDDGIFDRFSAFVLEAHNEHVVGKSYRDVISALQDKFTLVSWGNLNYKYCFITGFKL